MNPYLPREAQIIKRSEESPNTVSLLLRLTDGQPYDFAPGQFNMLYLYGCGEVAISVVSDTEDSGLLMHTIRALGRITRGLTALKPGSRIGLRGPFGRGWPMTEAEGHDVVIVAGGIGLAPLRPALYHALAHRERYGRVVLLYGARTPRDMLYRKELERWRGSHHDLAMAPATAETVLGDFDDASFDDRHLLIDLITYRQRADWTAIADENGELCYAMAIEVSEL